jgi:hypothetical protein
VGALDEPDRSSTSESDSQTAGIHGAFVREAARDTFPSGCTSPIAKDVSLLRSDHVAPEGLLPGMRPILRASLAQSLHFTTRFKSATGHL